MHLPSSRQQLRELCPVDERFDGDVADYCGRERESDAEPDVSFDARRPGAGDQGAALIRLVAVTLRAVDK